MATMMDGIEVQASKSRPNAKAITPQQWRDRQSKLPILQMRAQTVIQLIIGGMQKDIQTDEPKVPTNIAHWFREVHSQADYNGFTDALDLLKLTMQSFTLHKYIQLRDYESSLSEAHKTLPFGPEKILKILILANLAILLSHLISLTGEWDLKPAEERGLSINNIIQMFPSHFLAQEEKTSTAEAQVIVELRTQVFFLLFRQLRDERGDLGDWNTEEKIREVLQLDQGSQSDEKKYRGEYLKLAKARASVLKTQISRNQNIKTAMQKASGEHPWGNALNSLMTWIISHYLPINTYLHDHISPHDTKSKQIIPITPPPPRIRRTSPLPSPEPDSSDSDELPFGDRIRILAQVRSPRKAKLWAAQNIDPETANMSPAKARRLVKEEQQRATPSSLLNTTSPVNGTTGKGKAKLALADDPYELFQQLSGRRSVSVSSHFGGDTGVGKTTMRNVSVDLTTRKVDERTLEGRAQRRTSPELARATNTIRRSQMRESSMTGVAATKKKSLLDEQPDARRISFDSQMQSPTPPQPQPPSSPRKRRRETSSPPAEDDGDDFRDDLPPRPNRPRAHRTAVNTSSNHPANDAPIPVPPGVIVDRTEEILNKIHGPNEPESPSPAIKTPKASPTASRPIATPRPRGTPGRKGLGFAWSAEQEQFLMDQIEVYGPAWADIARANCGPGGQLEGRDQAKLKDKARNLKEKFIRKLPRHFDTVTPYGNFIEAKARMVAQGKL